MAIAKIFQGAAFRNEGGKTGVNQAPGWGSFNANTVLGANCGLPYTSLSKSRTLNNASDNSIIGQGFEDIPSLTGKYAEPSLSVINRFDGFNPLLYWAFGLEDEKLPVCCYVCSVPAIEPVAGAVYSDGTNSATFLRKEVNGSKIFYIFWQPAVVTLQSGTLTKNSGTGSNLSFTAHSPLMYESIMIVDPKERHLVEPQPSQILSGYTAGDKKCRMATVGIHIDTGTDFVYRNSMCKKFNFKSDAGDMSSLSFDFLSHDMYVGDYNSSLWTYPLERLGSEMNVLHHNLHVEVNGVVVGCTSCDLGFETPLQVIQDTVSGLYLAEPVMEGKYTFNCDITLSRYSSLAWQNLSAAWTEVPARIAAYSGYFLQEFFINNAVIVNADPSDEDVAKQTLKLAPGDCSINRMPNEGCSITDFSPIMCRVRNFTAQNYMLV